MARGHFDLERPGAVRYVPTVLPAGASTDVWASPSPKRDDRWFAAGVIILAALVGYCFGQVRHFAGPILDDDHAIVLNPHIGSLSASSLRWIVVPDFIHNPRLMPAGWLGVDLETRITGLNPYRMHVFVLALHALNSVALACVLRRLVIRLGNRGLFSTVLAPLVGASFYALHPMRAETLGWVSLGFWHQAVFFAVLWAWLRLEPVPRPIAEGAAYLMCLLSFPAFLGLAPAAAAVDWIQRGRQYALKRNGLILALAACCGAGTLYAVKVTSQPDVRPPFPMALQAVQVVAVEGHILIKSLLPLGLSPFAKPLHDLERGNRPEVAGCLLFLALWLLALVPRGRFVLPWLAAFTLLVAPFAWTANWRDPDIGNRYATASHLLLSAALACGFARLSAFPKAAVAAVAVATVVCLGLSSEQIRVWENDITLEAEIERLAPPGDEVYKRSVAVARSETAVCRFLLGDFTGALGDIDQSLGALPGDPAFMAIRKKIVGMQELIRARSRAGATYFPIPRVQEHWTIAADSLKEGDEAKARIHLEEIERLDPRYYQQITSN